MENRQHKTGSSIRRWLLKGAWGYAAISAVLEWLFEPEGKKAEPVRPTVHFEHSDISAKGVVLTGIGILLATWLIFVILYWPFQYFLGTHRHGAKAAWHGVTLPPKPRLQTSPSGDLLELHTASVSDLHKYEWVDHEKGKVAIPIERAIDLIAQRGIPAQKAPANMFYKPTAGSPLTGFEGKVEPEPR
jgi:hypothetical protein